MKGMLALVYPLKPYGFEHEALSTVLPNLERLLQSVMSKGVFKHLVLRASILAKNLNWCFNEKHQLFCCGYLMDIANEYLVRLQEIAQEVSVIQEKIQQLDVEVRIRLQSLVDENDCLLSRVDPYCDSGNSLADWMDKQ